MFFSKYSHEHSINWGKTVKIYGLEVIFQTCIWNKMEDGEEGYWDTSCGTSHLFFGGTPFDNHFLFCPYCGKKLEENKNEHTQSQDTEDN